MSLLSDWGAAEWSEDSGAARDYAEELVDQVASERAWSEDWRALALDKVYAAGGGFWDWLQSSTDYWGALSTDWTTGADDAPAGWTELGDTWDAALAAADTTADSREEGSASAVADAVAESAEDAAELATDWRPWAVVGAAVALTLAVWWRRA